MIYKEESRTITFLRVIAMFYIAFVLHILPCYISGSLLYYFGQMFGFVGVWTFFGVSGFLFGRKFKTSFNIKSAFRWELKRLKRILIPYYFVLIPVVVFSLIRGFNVSLKVLAVSILNLQGILQLKYAFDELGHTWFISIIMVCYLLTPLLAVKIHDQVFRYITWGLFLFVL